MRRWGALRDFGLRPAEMDSLDFLFLSNMAEMVVTLYARATTYFVLEEDRLIIRRGGTVSMNIPYRDMDLIEYADDKQYFFPTERLFRLSLKTLKVLRITINKKGDLHYILINPRDPDHLIKTWYWARYPAEAAAQGAPPIA
jgi:hypothetical protein